MIKISQLPEFTGNTENSYLVMNNSGETMTYKVKRNNLISNIKILNNGVNVLDDVKTIDFVEMNVSDNGNKEISVTDKLDTSKEHYITSTGLTYNWDLNQYPTLFLFLSYPLHTITILNGVRGNVYMMYIKQNVSGNCDINYTNTPLRTVGNVNLSGDTTTIGTVIILDDDTVEIRYEDGTTYSVNNGLTENSTGNFQLGGPLINPLTRIGSQNNLNITFETEISGNKKLTSESYHPTTFNRSYSTKYAGPNSTYLENISRYESPDGINFQLNEYNFITDHYDGGIFNTTYWNLSKNSISSAFSFIVDMYENLDGFSNTQDIYHEFTSYSGDYYKLIYPEPQYTGAAGSITRFLPLTVNGINADSGGEITLFMPQSSYLFSGGERVWLQNYQYSVSAAQYVILGQQLKSPLTTITLDPADSTFNRFDLIVVNNLGQVEVITGTPAANPTQPSYNPSTQLPLGFIEVVASSTEPTCNGIINIYVNEPNGSDWTATSDIVSSGTITIDSNFDSRTGGFSIRAENINNVDRIILSGSSIVNIDDIDQIVFYIKPADNWGTNNKGKKLSVRLYDETTPLGDEIIIEPKGTFGFDSSVNSVFQQIAINKNLLNIPSNTTFNKLVFEGRATGIGLSGFLSFYLDDVSFRQDCSNVITSSSRLEILDEGVSLSSAVKKINFTGSNVTATQTATDEIEVNISGGGGSGWSLIGNSGTTAGTNFLGTTDNQDLVFRRNNLQIARFYEDRLSIGLDAGNAYNSWIIGYLAGASNIDSVNSVFIGDRSGQSSINSSGSIFIGGSSGQYANNGASSIFLGYRAGRYSVNSISSIFIGDYAGSDLNGGSYSILLGSSVGKTFVGNNIGANNIIIGTNISLPNSYSNSINIGGVLFGTGTYYDPDPSNNPSISPTASGKIGIRTVNPQNTLHITSEAANTSGLRFTNLTSASPTSTGQTLGVNENGDVVTISSGGGGSITANNGLNMSTSTNVQLGGPLLSGSTRIGTQTSNYNGHQLWFRNDPTYKEVGWSTASTGFPTFTSNYIASFSNINNDQHQFYVSEMTLSGRSSNLKVLADNLNSLAEVSFETTFNGGSNFGQVKLLSTSSGTVFTIKNTDTITSFTTKPTGQVQLNAYGGSGFIGTATKWLAVDSSGNIIQQDAPSSGGSSNNSWLLLGNTGTTEGVNFIGTINNIPLEFRVNNIRSGKIGVNYTFFGYNAGRVDVSDISTAFGVNALYNNTSGLNNTAIGFDSLYSITTTQDNTAIGYRALRTTSNSYNTAIGSESLVGLTGGHNTGVGYNVGGSGSAQYNTFIGSLAGNSLGTGDGNTAVGYESMTSASAAQGITAIGYQALRTTTLGALTAIGYQAMYSATLPYNSVGLGHRVAYSLTNGSENTVVGFESMYFTITGGQNTTLGYISLYYNNNSENTAVGDRSLMYVTTGFTNTAIGQKSGIYVDSNYGVNIANTTSWTSSGWSVGSNNYTYTHTTGNTSQLTLNITPVVGKVYYLKVTISGLTSGWVTVSFGGDTSPKIFESHGASQITFSSNNTWQLDYRALDTSQLVFTPTSNFNGTIEVVFEERYANFIKNSVYIGSKARALSNTETNAIVIGSNAIGRGSNTTVIGNSSTTDTYFYGGIHNPSGLSDYADDAAAAAGGIDVNQYYRTGSVIKIRVS